MEIEPILKQNVKPIWCDGCGLYILESALAQVFTEQGYNQKNTVIVSGIGCSARISGYFGCDGIHTTHGRAIPVAEAIKIVRPELNIIVISGDGDLLGIGLNHLLHSSRRDSNITVICNRNEIYGMTGGQTASTTPKGAKTSTAPIGTYDNPVDTKPYIVGNEKHYYARTSITDLNHLKNAVTGGLNWNGFSYIEVISICPTNRGKMMGFANPAQMLMATKNLTQEGNKLYQLEIDYKDNIKTQ